MSEHPFIETVVTINGRDIKREDLLKARVAVLSKKCKRVEGFIGGLEDDELRDMLDYRYMQGFGWAKVMRKMGCATSPDAARKRVERFLEKIF